MEVKSGEKRIALGDVIHILSVSDGKFTARLNGSDAIVQGPAQSVKDYCPEVLTEFEYWKRLEAIWSGTAPFTTPKGKRVETKPPKGLKATASLKTSVC